MSTKVAIISLPFIITWFLVEKSHESLVALVGCIATIVIHTTQATKE